MIKERLYFNPKSNRNLSINELRKARKKTKIEVMKAWFLSNYESPSDSLPRDEGEYIYIWGGPYYAQQEIYTEFHDLGISEEIIDELVQELNDMAYEWSIIPKYEDTSAYDEYLAEIILKNNKYYENFNKGISDIKSILKTNLDASSQEYLYRLLYANLITLMETYLSDAFINIVITDKKYIRRLIENTPEFKEQKISVSEIFKELDNIEERVKTYLVALIWHRLDKVTHLYKNALNIDFPYDIKGIFRAINTRHDLVHRNGKTKDDKKISITRENVMILLDEIESFINEVEGQIYELKRSQLEATLDV